MNGLQPPSSPHSLPCEWYASLVTFSLLSPECLCFVQHSYFIAPDINGLPTIPESVSTHGKRKEGRQKEIKRDPSPLETCLPLIAFNQIHLSPFEIIASSPCFSFISCGACTFNVEVQWSPWVLEDSNCTHVLCWFVLKVSLSLASEMVVVSQNGWKRSSIWQIKATLIDALCILWFKSVFLTHVFVCRDGSPFLASAVCLSLRHTLALSQSVTLTLYCKQVVQGQFVMYLHILLFLSISRGTWQSTLWLWTSTTCSSSTPVCCTNGASSLPQASLALWVHSLRVSVSAAVSYQLCLVRQVGETWVRKYCNQLKDEFPEHFVKVEVKLRC